jgi:hypothetical protein
MLDSGAFQIVRELHGTPDRGIYRGRERWSNRSVLVTLGAPQTLDADALRAKLEHRGRGVTRLRFIGHLEANVETEYTGLVEDEPDGAPASEALALPLDPARAVKLAFTLGEIAYRARHPFVGLRPELIYVRDAAVTAVAPRTEPFFVTASPRCYGVPPCFDLFYLAREVIARPRAPATDLADVFSICAILAHWVTGEHPFEGIVAAEQAISIAATRRRPWTGPPELGAIIDAGLAPEPENRTELVNLLAALEAV